jgi:hypothetical protein
MLSTKFSSVSSYFFFSEYNKDVSRFLFGRIFVSKFGIVSSSVSFISSTSGESSKVIFSSGKYHSKVLDSYAYSFEVLHSDGNLRS